MVNDNAILIRLLLTTLRTGIRKFTNLVVTHSSYSRYLAARQQLDLDSGKAMILHNLSSIICVKGIEMTT